MRPQSKPFQIERKGKVLIVRFREVSGLAVSDLREKVARELQEPRWRDVSFAVLDCSELAYANSLFLEILLDIKHHAEAKDGAIAICGVSEVVRDVLRVSRLDELCPVYDSLDEAIAALMG